MEINLDLSDTLTAVKAEPKEMLGMKKEGERWHISMNYSSLEIIQACARKAQYALVRGLRSDLESPATLFGSAIHKALEVWYGGDIERRTLPKDWKKLYETIPADDTKGDESLYSEALLAFKKAAEPLGHLDLHQIHSIPNGCWILGHYFDRYQHDTYTILKDSTGTPYIERKVRVPIVETQEYVLEFFGSIDCIMKDEATGHVMVCDHKTFSSRFKSSFMDKLNPNFQYTGYLHAAREVLGIDTWDFLVNGLEKKPIPKTSRGSIPDFMRQITSRTEHDVTELKASLMHAAERMIQWTDEGFYPMSTPTPCNLYGGCQYHDICSAPHALRENVIKTKYTGVNQ